LLISGVQCIAGWLQFEGHCYFISANSYPWATAQVRILWIFT